MGCSHLVPSMHQRFVGLASWIKVRLSTLRLDRLKTSWTWGEVVVLNMCLHYGLIESEML